MNQLINDIIDEIKAETGMTKYDIERIIDSQYKALQLAIENRDLRTTNLIYLGKVKPSNWFINNHELITKRKRYYTRVEEPLNE